jgi:hypothetical protein
MDSMRWGWTAFGLVLSCSAFACSSSSPGGSTSDAGDSGTLESSVKDAPVLEALPPFDGHFGGDGGDPGTGTLLQPFYGAVIDGVTSDGWVVYSNGGEVPTFYAASLDGGDGGAATSLGLAESYAYAFVVGEVTFLFTNIDVDATYSSPLSIWSSKGGQHLITENSYFQNAAVSSDNQYILYYDNFNSLAETADLYVASSDGSSPKLLQSALPNLMNGGNCQPNFGFAGTTAYVVYCGTPGDGGAANDIVMTFAPPSWAATNNLSGATSLNVGTEPTNTYLSVATASGLLVVPLAGGIPTPIDPTGLGGVFTSDSKNLVYNTSTKTLSRSPIAAPSPSVLVTGAVGGIYGLSPDNSTALVFASASQGLTDLYAASATKTDSGALTTLSSAATATPAGYGILAGDAFTADSAHVLFFTAVQQTTDGELYATLNTGSATGGTVTTLSPISNTAWVTSGTKVVFSDNLVFGASTTLDIRAVDVAAGGTPTYIRHGATAGGSAAFYLSPAKDKIIYSWTSPGTENGGIYVAPAP